MSINGQGHSLTLVKGHSDFKVKCLNFDLYTQVSDLGPLGPLVVNLICNVKSEFVSSGLDFLMQLYRLISAIAIHTCEICLFKCSCKANILDMSSKQGRTA